MIQEPQLNIPFSTCTPYYVRAIHDYLPSSIDNIDESASCLYFKKDSIIKVLNKDNSGWWDGQCGNKRGWFPSNYVSYDASLTRQRSAEVEITCSTTQDWNQKMMRPCFNFPNVSQDDYSIKNAADAERRPPRTTVPDISSSMEIVSKRVTDLVTACNQYPTDIQQYTTRVVSSVKSILVEFNMLNKDSYFLRTHLDLAKQRKIILIALNRLITRSKDLYNAENLEREQKQLVTFANELMNSIHHLTKLLATIPRRPLSNITDSTVESEVATSLFDTPRSSVSSTGYYSAKTHSCSNTSLRHYLTETRRTNFSLPNGKKELLHDILNYQSGINDLIEQLKVSLEDYLKNRRHATVVLDITRKVMEMVMSFLAAVEHVCSNISELDDSRRAFTIPKKPSHVTLIITKESVYSTITNLVTAIRILTEPTTRLNEDHLYSCCQGVLKTTTECTLSIRACLEENMQELSEKNHSTTSQLSNFSSTLIQQHINKQHHFDNTPLHNTSEMNEHKRSSLSLASSEESFQSSQSFSTLSDSSHISTTNVIQEQPVKKDLPLLPPIQPPVSSQDIMVKTTPRPLKARLSRGLSVSSLRASFSRSQRQPSTTESESKRLPSWMTMHASVVKPEKNSHVDISAPFISEAKKEPEYPFLKKFAYKEENMILNVDGEVVGATVQALVQRLTVHEKSSDPDFVRAFFYTFRLFSSPVEFLDLLIDRYHLTAPANLSKVQAILWSNRVLTPIRFRVYHAIKTWLEVYFDRDQDFCIKDKLVDFVSDVMSKVMPGPAKRLTELIAKTFHSKGGISYATADRALKRSVSTSMHSTISKSGNLFSNLTKIEDCHEIYPQPILGKGIRNAFRKNSNLTSVSVTRIHSVELARQLTLMENHLFCQIEASEMVGQEFKKKVEHSHALHVKAMIQKSTQITGWVSDTILKEKDVKKRCNVLKHWIKVGDACLQFNNFNTLMAIRSALDSASIIRLKKTWDHLSLKYKVIWETIQKATDSQRNFAEYRQRLKKANAPCLPFLGIYLTDMTFIDDGNPDCRTSPNGKQLINFNKYVKMAKILNEINHFQVPYKFIEVEEIQGYIKTTLQKVQQDDELFYARSLKCEPKEEE